MSRSKIAILGADISAFHLFNRLYRSDDRYEVICFFELHHLKSYDSFQYLTWYPMKFTGDLYQGINICHSIPYKQAHKPLDKVIFSPSALTSPQYLYSVAEFTSMDASVVTHSLECTRLPPPKALVSFFSSTQFDIPILSKMLQIYKEMGANPVIVMPCPLYPFSSKENDVDPFFLIRNTSEFEQRQYYFNNRHELEMIKMLLDNKYMIYFVCDFEEFSSEAMKSDDFDMIVFVGSNLLPCFFESHLVVFACDDFTFGDEITVHPSFILCQQADVIIYAHLGSPDSGKQIKEKSGASNFVSVPVKYSAKNSNCYPRKVALLVDDSYPTHVCHSSRSISQFLATSFNMVPYDMTQNVSTDLDEAEVIYGAPTDKNWPANILPETAVGVTNFNENRLKNLKNYDIVVSSTSTPCGLKPPSPIQVMQFVFDVDLNELKPDFFALPAGALVKRKRKA